MEYSSFTLQGGVTSKLTCSVCNIDEINIQGKIKYAFFFLEFLPQTGFMAPSSAFAENILKNNISEINKSFLSKNSFKGKIGTFDINNNRINHRLNFYQVNQGAIKEIF